MSRSEQSLEDPYKVGQALAQNTDYSDYMRLNWAVGARAMACRTRHSEVERRDGADTNKYSLNAISKVEQQEQIGDGEAADVTRFCAWNGLCNQNQKCSSITFTLCALLLALLLGSLQVLLVLSYQHKVTAVRERVKLIKLSNLTNESVEFQMLLQSHINFSGLHDVADKLKQIQLRLPQTLELLRRNYYNYCINMSSSRNYNETCFYYSKNSAKWIVAQRRCEDMGGALATVDNDYLVKQLDLLVKNQSYNELYWIGLHVKNGSLTCDQEERKWIWVESQNASTYQPFNTAQPSSDANKQIKNCAGILSNSFESRPCDDLYHFICMVRNFE